MLVAGVDVGIRRLAVAHALQPIQEMVGAGDQFDVHLAADLAVALRATVGAVGRGVPVVDGESAFVAVEFARVAGEISEIVRARDHEALGVVPRGDDVVGGREVVFVFPIRDAAHAHARLRQAAAGDIVHEIEEVRAPLRDGALAEFVVAIPRGVLGGVEGTGFPVAEEFLPVDVFLLHLAVEVRIPVGLLAVPRFVDAGDLTNDAVLHELAGAHDSREAAELCADLDDAAGGLCGLGGVVGADQFVHLGGEGFLDVNVFAGLGDGFEMRRVVEIG